MDLHINNEVIDSAMCVLAEFPDRELEDRLQAIQREAFSAIEEATGISFTDAIADPAEAGRFAVLVNRWYAIEILALREENAQ